jgi:type 1 glutamine amidotransferase
MKRRQLLKSLGAAMLGGRLAVAAEQAPRRKILFFSRSVLFEHPVVRRQGTELSFAEKEFAAIAAQIGCDAQCTKDGGVFDRDLDAYAAVVTYSCGKPSDLMKQESLDNSPPLTERGWKNLDRAVQAGKPLVGVHPGIWLLGEAFGADFLGHGSQQVGRMVVVSPRFPGVAGLGESFSMMEEWFSLVRFAKDVHAVLVQDCSGMNKSAPLDRQCYDRPPYPATWARMHGKGRVFYTSMGHREDVWTSKPFRQVLQGGLRWALGDAAADIPPNAQEVAPRAEETPRT